MLQLLFMLVSLMASDVLLYGPKEPVPVRSDYNADGLLLAPLLEARQGVSEVNGALFLRSTFVATPVDMETL